MVHTGGGTGRKGSMAGQGHSPSHRRGTLEAQPAEEASSSLFQGLQGRDKQWVGRRKKSRDVTT